MPISAFDQAQAFLAGFVLFLFHRFAFDFQLDQAAVEFVHHFRFGVDFILIALRLRRSGRSPCPAKAVGDVAMAQLPQQIIAGSVISDAVVDFVFLLQAAQDGDGGLDARLVHQHFLEAALQRGIFSMYLRYSSSVVR